MKLGGQPRKCATDLGGSLGQTPPDVFPKTVTDVLLDGRTLTDRFPFDVASPSVAVTGLTSPASP